MKAPERPRATDSDAAVSKGDGALLNEDSQYIPCNHQSWHLKENARSLYTPSRPVRHSSNLGPSCDNELSLRTQLTEVVTKDNSVQP